MIRLLRCIQDMRALIEMPFCSMGMSRAESMLLMMASGAPPWEEGELKWSHPLRASDIARELEITPGAVSHLLKNLQEKGLIERITAKSDRRVVNVVLTKEGEALAGVARERITCFAAALLEGLTPEETEDVFSLFAKVNRILEEQYAKYGAEVKKRGRRYCGSDRRDGKETVCDNT